jgi:aerobic-type carbon monoxide dehydrogenase small subunit (CoxS/CutS family)
MIDARRIGSGVDAGDAFTFFVDGAPVEAVDGETIAVALLAAGRRALRTTAKRREPRGLYCVMGVCWECAVVVDGRTTRACVTLARPGLRVETLTVGASR